MWNFWLPYPIQVRVDGPLFFRTQSGIVRRSQLGSFFWWFSHVVLPLMKPGTLENLFSHFGSSAFRTERHTTNDVKILCTFDDALLTVGTFFVRLALGLAVVLDGHFTGVGQLKGPQALDKNAFMRQFLRPGQFFEHIEFTSGKAQSDNMRFSVGHIKYPCCFPHFNQASAAAFTSNLTISPSTSGS
jgi:hypothetical protein